MYFPLGTWQVVANAESGKLQIGWRRGGAPDEIDGSVFGHPITGQLTAATGDISFQTTDGTARSYSGSLVIPRDSAPEAMKYILAGSVTDGPRSYPWVADQTVVP